MDTASKLALVLAIVVLNLATLTGIYKIKRTWRERLLT